MALPAVGDDGNVAHFAREAAVASQKQMIDHHAQPDARAHIEHGEAVEIARFAINVLGQAKGMRIVHQRAIGIESLAQILAKFLAGKKWQIGGQTNFLPAIVDEADHTDADAQYRHIIGAKRLHALDDGRQQFFITLRRGKVC